MDTQMILGKQPKQHRTLWISDVHLGTRNCQARALLDFLALYLVRSIPLGIKFIGASVSFCTYSAPAGETAVNA